ncbi:MAG: hypothetical protein OXC62_11005 [Aestuariivita sp.]|nr:hypothetical protein [Aestuariivita sp.]
MFEEPSACGQPIRSFQGRPVQMRANRQSSRAMAVVQEQGDGPRHPRSAVA